MIEKHLEGRRGQLMFRFGGQGPLVVFSHGLGPLAWGDLKSLTAVCTVAIPDWERSSLDRSAGLGGDWFEDVVAACCQDTAALCAWSMAGPAAIRYAATSPPALSRLILVDVAGITSRRPQVRLRDMPHLVLPLLLKRPTRGAVHAMWKSWVRGKVDTTALEDATYRWMRAQGLESWKARRAEALAKELKRLMGDVQVPTLILAGKYSSVLGPQAGQLAADLAPSGHLVVFEASAHAPQLEEPERFMQVLAEFVRGQAA